MDLQTAKDNIGQPFKYSNCAHWDTIRSVSDDGMITGDKIEAPIEDCRLKQPVPEGFKKRGPLASAYASGEVDDVDALGRNYSDADPGL